MNDFCHPLSMIDMLPSFCVVVAFGAVMLVSMSRVLIYCVLGKVHTTHITHTHNTHHTHTYTHREIVFLQVFHDTVPQNTFSHQATLKPVKSSRSHFLLDGTVACLLLYTLLISTDCSDNRSRFYRREAGGRAGVQTQPIWPAGGFNFQTLEPVNLSTVSQRNVFGISLTCIMVLIK